MGAPKISAMENEPRNLAIGTLIRVVHALGSRVEIRLVRRKGRSWGVYRRERHPATLEVSSDPTACGTRRTTGPTGSYPFDLAASITETNWAASSDSRTFSISVRSIFPAAFA
jgi:hypothetical protein